MKRGLLLLLGAALFLAGRAQAQDASVQDDMRFIEELRKQGKSDLALEYLEKVAKNASPELAKALPLEMAQTRLEAAGEEPDSTKRLALYGEARRVSKVAPGQPRRSPRQRGQARPGPRHRSARADAAEPGVP